jgi:hypothetical protein
MLEAYFDESGTHADSPVMCVSGFLFNPRNRRGLEKEWRAELQRVQQSYRNVKHFHMKELAPGGGQFRDVPNEERQAIERRLVEIINLRKTYGFTAAVSETEFFATMPPNWIASWGQPYTTCVRLCLQYMGHWADRNRYYGQIAYVFENGHRHQFEAEQLLRTIAADPEAARQIRYGSHRFADKRLVLALQAADVMAWQFHRMAVVTEIKGERPIRQALRSLGKGRGTDSANQCDFLRGERLRRLLAENPVPGTGPTT